MTTIPTVSGVSIGRLTGTDAKTDHELVASWVDGLTSGAQQAQLRGDRRCASSRRCRSVCARRRSRTCARRSASSPPTAAPGPGGSTSSGSSRCSRYAHRLGYTPFNAGVVLKVKSAARGAQLAKRILPEVDVKLLIRAARTERDRVLLAVAYGGGLRVSELVGLTWGDVIVRDKQVQLSVLGKGGVVRQVLLPKTVSRQLLDLRGDAGASPREGGGPVFAARHGGPLTERAVHGLVKRTARAAGINEKVSPHWLRHAHGSHAIDRGAPLPEVQATLGHANVATTSGYLHARPDTSSGLYLDEGIFR